MHYSTEPIKRRYVKGYGFLSFAKNIGKNLSNLQVRKLQVFQKNQQKNCKMMSCNQISK